MFKEFTFVFYSISLYLIRDVDMVPLAQISQWSGQINGIDNNQTYFIPGFGMGNGGGSNGMSSGSGNGMGGGGNQMSNGASNGTSSAPGNGFGGMGGGPSNGFGGMGNGFGMGGGGNGGNSNWSYSNIQSHVNGVPGSGYPASYYQQYSNQSIIVPTPANIEDLQNTTAPDPNGYMDQMNANGANMGNMGNMGNMNNVYNPSAFQFQGCVPQSSFGSVDPVPQSTDGSSTNETTTAGTTETADGSQENNTSTTTSASTRKRNKH